MTNRAEIVITALDKASAVINRISDRLDNLGTKSNVGKAWERLGETAGMERVSGALSKITGNLQAIAGVASVAAGAVAGVFSTAVNAVDDFGDSMANAGIKGQQLVEISALRDYLGQFGVSSEDASAAMLKLTGNISSAVAGNKEALAAFAATGVSMEDLKKKSPVDVLTKMMDVFSQSDKSGAKLKVLQALAGKSSVKMAEGLSQGVEKFEEYKQQAKAALLTEKDFEDAGNAADSMTRITGLIARAAQKMAAVAAPKVQAFLDRREAGLLELIPKLVDWMDRFVNSFDEEKVMGFFEDVGEVVSGVTAAFKWLSDNTSTTTRVLLLLAVAFAPTIAALFSIGTVALPLVITGLQALGAAALANPFGLVIAAIAAGVYLIYKNWDGIVEYFTGVWGRIKAVFEVNFFDGLIQLYLESWQALGNGIIGIIKSIPLVRDLDIVKNMPQLEFATKRAAAVTGNATVPPPVIASTAARVAQSSAIATQVMATSEKASVPPVITNSTARLVQPVAAATRAAAFNDRAAPAPAAADSARLSQLDAAARRTETAAGRTGSVSPTEAIRQPAAFGGGQTAAQSIRGGGGKTEVGGRIQLEILGAPTKVRQLSSVNSAVPIDVSAGLYGIGG
ncbi:hypothetical protein SAMN05518865_110167 [Duganella sp. CF458]|uniref:hypothetical protein n=1 Tax=Duganella sp. CF458 TaxID=1884368 RepID=UPI0008ED13C3|nr:hypothetical protein [Duganella sp. CF458]SFG29553.1 hypothetical protein SAMN05518865_110167 [Duganella sp. CF458]